MQEGARMGSSMTFVATGDSFITRRLPDRSSESFRSIANLIGEAEFRFTNLEVTTHRLEGFPFAFSGGTWAMAQPEVLADLQAYGFNIMAWANNHTMDYAYGGLEATRKYLDEYGISHAGVGLNLAEASQPVYLDCPSGRVALVAATSTFHESWIAGEQRPDMPGRPGVNPLRYETTYTLPQEDFAHLDRISRLIPINASYNLDVKEGFAVPSNGTSIRFGAHRFVAGEAAACTTVPVDADKQRMLRSISEAKRQADYVIVSIHSHEMEGENKAASAAFFESMARACIDGGADAVLGHGPHILRGIEIYRNRPIFYSLGNFIFQNETVHRLPADFYEKYSLGHEATVADAFDTRTDHNKKGLGVNPYVWESVIPYWRMEDGRLKELLLYPIELGYGTLRYQRGWPTLSKQKKILEHLQELSEPYGTKIEWENGVGKVLID
ncbi:poly-gamma-glutamate synthesis protein (capsule biosynthesis protein) [Brevibacillus centrosporus]|jgi:poly-gamma-glutamate synthesis protein (capsule biosynthesis protein)|uniref:Poly-gamma-glutamate synthesis protein (Capsule biosynthesis protein) n=2 Tax=Brevibacillus centrosporus TaxID=54910 RepID=A0A1I3T3G5_9BACL|nr:poly-gamma-glutamate synthesis protein (capsule biosynthesis protein) [Brevibacillus centrosporus]